MNKNPEPRTVLCGANAYETKYYLNNQFSALPTAILDELNILCVLFTEEVGGIFTIGFEPDGTIILETAHEESDFYYDEVSSGLMIREVRRKRQELFESLELYYRVKFLNPPGNEDKA
ncbi:MAG: DUF6145 family protein [Lachnospiraceae bacterium]|nr:DUF6145 family protein [Lachnospiraceae bacterium]